MITFDDLQYHIIDGVVNDIEGDQDKLNAIVKSSVARFEDLSGVAFNETDSKHIELLIPIVNYILCSMYNVTEERQKVVYFQFDLIKPTLQALKWQGVYNK